MHCPLHTCRSRLRRSHHQGSNGRQSTCDCVVCGRAWELIYDHVLRARTPEVFCETGIYHLRHIRGRMKQRHTISSMRVEKTGFPPLLGFASLWEKHWCRTKLASVPRRWRSWVQKFGVQRASRSCPGELWPGWWQNDWWRKKLWDVLLGIPDVQCAWQAENIVTSLEDRHLEGCLGELQDAARSLDHQGFVTRPSWAELSEDARLRPAGRNRIGRSRNWPKSNFALFLTFLSFFFSFAFVFLLFFTFFLFLLISLSSFCFCSVSVFVPKNLN